MIKFIFVLIALGVFACLFLWTKNYYTGPKSDHFDGRYFHNVPDRFRTFDELVKWLWNRKPTPWPEHIEIEKFAPPKPRSAENEMKVTFVNHATVLIQWNGVNILTDPVWSERASPFTWMGPKRVHEPGILWEDLPKIDVVLISHNHYDHMDRDTLHKLYQRDRPIMVTGLGNGTILKGFEIPHSIELDWWQTTDVTPNFAVTYVPAQHFSARWPWDKDKALWGGFVIKNQGDTVYFMGDSGDGDHFTDIGEKFGPFRLALIPIGAYEPRWFMKPAHINPQEAVAIHQLLKSNTSIAIHFGTFPLSDEGIDQPQIDLKHALENAKLSENEFLLLKPGESRQIP